jgi:signal transduction histidine kinase/sensor domain CHASE-containing protein
MSLKNRFALVALSVFGCTSLLFLIGLWLFRDHSSDHREDHQKAEARMIGHILEMGYRPLATVIRDHSQWIEAVRFLEGDHPGWPDANLGYLIESDFNADRIWLFDSNGALAWTRARGTLAEPDPPPLPGSLKTDLADRSQPVRFYARVGSEVLRLEAAAIRQGTQSSRNAPGVAGYLIGAQVLDAGFVQRMAGATNASVVEIVARDRGRPDGPETGSANVAKIQDPSLDFEVPVPLADATGRVFADLVFGFRMPHLGDAGSLPDSFVYGFLLIGLLAVAIVIWAGTRLVIHPLERLSEAVDRGDRATLERYREGPGELARTAELCLRSLHQEDALRAEIEQRKTVSGELQLKSDRLEAVLDQQEALARNLHDGIIQELYASGLHLAVIREGMKGDEPASQPAVEGLDRVIRNLNGLIADVRNFIVGLEPALLYQADLVAIFDRLQQNLTQVAPDDFILLCEPEVGTQLDGQLKLELFFIVRELLSNAIRHAVAPTFLHCTLERTDDRSIRLTCTNDGARNPETTPGGLGLPNLRSRVQKLGGTLRLNHPAREHIEIVILLPSP